MSFRLDCAVDCAKALLDGSARKRGVLPFGGTILPEDILVKALLSQPCRCQKHRRPAIQLAPSYSASITNESSQNPIWGTDKPLPMREAAFFAGMPFGTLRQKVYRREIETVMVGRERQIQPSALRAYLARQKKPAI